MRYLLRIAYDGTRYHGWQRQPGTRTVQGVIERALTKLAAGTPIDIIGASRTDAGVHAEEQLAVFDYHGGRLTLRDFSRGLDAITPDDITIRHVEPVHPDLHPRFDARGKWYRYQIWAGTPCPPRLRPHVWYKRRRKRLEVECMREASAALVGQHDFSAFRASDCEARTAIRTIESVSIDASGEGYLAERHAERGSLITIDVCGNAFLKNMVRIIAGTLSEVGLRRRSVASVAQAVASGVRTDAGITAPPTGLTLVRVMLAGEVVGSSPQARSS